MFKKKAETHSVEEAVADVPPGKLIEVEAIDLARLHIAATMQLLVALEDKETFGLCLLELQKIGGLKELSASLETVGRAMERAQD